ncbi:TetR/AcrR family transcriptional regulator [Brevibacterium casei]|uniref:TetR family transcriptional regulator n=1 Tax=Brevibacterium casei S18 TaxID=1229781 RepID=K9AWZ7_9MICO|nr:TetR/AcrR family transcriptional regulator [Brevibacterium casei]EKU46040.1 TetR family transcriptional regulator [Brevibacterium casei S18]MCT2182443.1 TetR/AcrR family transcriptional regulator [Brevibacterium casei]MCT2358732.1 TetR/AcrR family transcriptional regulator [Brevibacterium casei]NJE66978.1 TetR/AcrR family transcriptional regulator [Brevibacterium sp. LS14]
MSKSSSPAQTPSTATESVAGDLAEAGAGSGSAAEAGVGSEPKRTRRGRPGYDRETLINKATEVFVSRGYDGTSMDTVARELGITKSAIYHHVKSKEELLQLAINRGTDALASAVESESHRQDLSALERLRHAVHSSVLILIEYHHSVTLLLRVRGNSAVERDALEQRRKIDMKIRALVTAAIEEGGVRADFPPGLVTRLLFGMVNSITEWYRPGYPVDPETIAEAVTAMAFNGLAE